MVFLPQEVIAKKRNGLPLSDDEIAQFIGGLTNGAVSDAQAAAFAMAVYFNPLSMDERVQLTLAMRDSGETLDWRKLDGAIADKHSTGGVGDNLSLMLAPILAACGVFVPMISGRGLGHTGGTLDKFDAIPGYQTNPDIETFRKVTAEVGCAIIGQTSDLAPADRKLYAIRDVTATVESTSLITASILSKKLAAGLDALVLDVKCGSGAFMQSEEDARELANSLVSVANGAGMKTSALITDMNETLAKAAGNALEVQDAINFLIGEVRDPRQEKITLALCGEILAQVGIAPDAISGEARAKDALASGKAAEKFAAMVSALGGPADLIQNPAKHLRAAPIVRDIFPQASGHVAQINAREVGMAVVALGGGRRKPTDEIDYAVGFDRLASLNDAIDEKTPIARLHARDEASAAEATKRLHAAYVIGEQVSTTRPILARIAQGDAS